MSLYGALAEAQRQGKEILCVEVQLDENGEAVIATPFATIDGIFGSVLSGSAPTTTVLTFDYDGSEAQVYAWMPTATNDTTLVASDGEENLFVTVIGRRRTG